MDDLEHYMDACSRLVSENTRLRAQLAVEHLAETEAEIQKLIARVRATLEESK